VTSKPLVRVEEYLKMSFNGPDREYLDGEIVERHLGSIPHFKAQERLLEFFRSLKQNFSLFAYPEVTLRLSPTRYRVADVAVFAGGAPGGTKYPTDPPHIVAEIVSEDDRHVDIVEKLADYQAWGVRHVWLVDPWTRKLFVYDSSGLRETTCFELQEFEARLSLDEIFTG